MFFRILVFAGLLFAHGARADVGDFVKDVVSDVGDFVEDTANVIVPPRAACGSSGQRHCTRKERLIGRCDPGVFAHQMGVCFTPKNDAIGENITRGGEASFPEIARSVRDLADKILQAQYKPAITPEMIGELSEAFKPAVKLVVADLWRHRRLSTGTLLAALRTIDPIALQRIVERSPKIDATYETLKAAGFETLAVGDAAGAGFGKGVQGEIGLALDVRQARGPVVYGSISHSKGAQAFVGNDVVVSAFDIPNCSIGGTPPEFDPPVYGISGIGRCGRYRARARALVSR